MEIGVQQYGMELTTRRYILNSRCRQFLETLNNGHYNEAIDFFTDCVVVHTTEPLGMHGKDAVSDYMNTRLKGKLIKISCLSSHIDLSKGRDIAFQKGIYKIIISDLECDILDICKYLLVWRKIDSRWYVVVLRFKHMGSPILI
jgi:ketosteroid isomerase-like protein